LHVHLCKRYGRSFGRRKRDDSGSISDKALAVGIARTSHIGTPKGIGPGGKIMVGKMMAHQADECPAPSCVAPMIP
jgi:hypothetical protein